jgi:hypothetical protein
MIVVLDYGVATWVQFLTCFEESERRLLFLRTRNK